MAKVIQLYGPHGSRKTTAPELPQQLQYLKDQLRTELLSSIKEMLDTSPGRCRKWLPAQRLSKQLKISLISLRRLRESGDLSFCYIDGETYYNPQEVRQEMRRRKSTQHQ